MKRVFALLLMVSILCVGMATGFAAAEEPFLLPGNIPVGITKAELMKRAEAEGWIFDRSPTPNSLCYLNVPLFDTLAPLCIIAFENKETGAGPISLIEYSLAMTSDPKAPELSDAFHKYVEKIIAYYGTPTRDYREYNNESIRYEHENITIMFSGSPNFDSSANLYYMRLLCLINNNPEPTAVPGPTPAPVNTTGL